MTLAILSALRRQGKTVQAFKAGPDFIDPGHHALATGRPSRNLDTWMLSAESIKDILADASQDADISIVEGVMGLYDGFGGAEEAGSTAHLAKILSAPVVLVIDAGGMARSAAAMLKGYAEFDKAVRVAGVLFNNVGSPKHFDMLRAAVQSSCGLPVLGYLPRDAAVRVPERHLGLITSAEEPRMEAVCEGLAALASRYMDWEGLLRLAQSAPPLQSASRLFIPAAPASRRKPRIGIAWDSAFQFYYPDNLRLLELAGAECVRFSLLRDSLPDDLDMLYLGGGFPETHAAALAANVRARGAVKDFALRKKKPVYAECGGLMYLCQNIRLADGAAFPMAGVVPADAVMAKRFQALGYVQVDVQADNLLSRKGEQLRGHEFHWSYLEPKPGYEQLRFAYTTSSRLGERQKQDGIMIENALASYAHLHFAHAPGLVRRFLSRS